MGAGGRCQSFVLVCLLPRRLVSVDGEREVLPTAQALLGAAEPSLLSPRNLWARPPLNLRRQRIPHCASVPGKQSDALGGSGGWMWWVRLPTKMEVGPSSVSGGSPSLVLNGIALPQTGQVCDLGDFLDSQLPLGEQVPVVAKRAFAQLHAVCQLCPFLDREALLSVLTPALITSCIDSCNVAALKSIQNLQLASRCSSRSGFGRPQKGELYTEFLCYASSLGVGTLPDSHSKCWLLPLKTLISRDQVTWGSYLYLTDLPHLVKQGELSSGPCCLKNFGW